MLVVLGAAAICALTLTPEPKLSDQVDLLPVSCMVCGDLGGTDVALNLLLFTPFAAGLALLGCRVGRVLVIAGLVSLSIETMQFAWLPGRDASLSDLVTNTTGAVAAAFLTHRRALFFTPTARQARTLALGGLLLWTAVEMGSAWALTPSLPTSVYYGQWAANLGHLERFTGEVLGATVSGDSLPARKVGDSGRLRSRLLQGNALVTARATTGTPPPDLAPIISIFDRQHVEILLLGQRRDEAVFRMRTKVSDLRLRPPAIRIPDAIPDSAGVPIELGASYSNGRYFLHVLAAGRVIERTLDATPNWAWSYFMPLAHYALGESMYAITALWLGGLLLPMGYWAGRSAAPLVPTIAWASVPAVLLLAPAMFNLPRIHLSEWCAAAAGLGTGHLLARLSLGRQRAGAA